MIVTSNMLLLRNQILQKVATVVFPIVFLDIIFMLTTVPVLVDVLVDVLVVLIVVLGVIRSIANGFSLVRFNSASILVAAVVLVLISVTIIEIPHSHS